MSEIRFPKIIKRENQKNLELGSMRGKVVYTSDWEDVVAGRGVKCRTWEIAGAGVDMDGADITIEAGGYTPIQYVSSAEVVVDSPESGEAYCLVMDPRGQIYINVFDEQKGGQMVFTQGMIITWIAKTDVTLTEFESPKFSDQMFINIPEDTLGFNGTPLSQYMEIVKEFRQKSS